MSKIVCSGALFYALDTKRFLFLHRASGKTAGTWGLVGGGSELGETPFEALKREIKEEIGDTSKIIKNIPLETFVSNDEKFNFHTYLVVVNKEFLPNLNKEHNGYAWSSFGQWPKTLHQGLRNTLQNKTNLAKLETVFQVIDLLEE
jgi:8-oxo-dGTP pyrophosphatase MutT (NUDIX family)